MPQTKSLNAQSLRSFCQQAEFNFKTTDDLPDYEGIIGQNRAIDALSFAIEIDKPGYNIFLMGSKGLGKQTLLKQFLDKACIEQNAADDWCYVFNFTDPAKPIAINFPSGQGLKFRDAMQQLLRDLEVAFVKIFSEKEIIKREKIIRDVVAELISKLKAQYPVADIVLKYLSALENDVITNLLVFCDTEHAHLGYEECTEFLNFKNYEINLLVEQKNNRHAPVIREDNPTFNNLFGQIEYVSQLGSVVTDYHYINAGALHKANGGYLIVDADDLLEEKGLWETFKRALKNNEIKIPYVDANAGNVALVSLQPEAIPLDVKVILVGSRALYNKLVDNDDDFAELFKVEVDFSSSIDCDKDSLNQYAQVIAKLIRKNKLLAFDKAAVESVIEYGMRQIEDTTQLSIHMHSIQELLIEADFWANKEKQTIVRSNDVQCAIEKQIYRADRYRENIYAEINKGTILIDVSGEKVASVNGLFVIEEGRLEFAQPARITANVRIGDGDIIDIEREVDLGGPLHSKGVLILSSYLGSRYATSKPLSFTASIVVEQSYGSVDGDSATVGELCTLLSAISNLPMKQSLAITGSADQHGNVQAIGGINEKIEGFFDICKLRCLTGEQGVIVPAVNIPHLVLREDVIAAIEKDQFSIYPINTVDEAISLLTGLSAGERNEKGEFPEGSANYKVEQRLLELAELKHEDKDEHDHEHDKVKKYK